MRNIYYRIGNLELRRTENIGTKEYYLEIVEWLKDDGKKDYCYTVAIFEETKEGDYNLESVGDRIIFNKDYEWGDFGILVKQGFAFLNSIGEEEK